MKERFYHLQSQDIDVICNKGLKAIPYKKRLQFISFDSIDSALQWAAEMGVNYPIFVKCRERDGRILEVW